MAFLLAPAPQLVIKRSHYTFPVTCEHREYRKSSGTNRTFSVAAAAAVLSVPFISNEREGAQSLYSKAAPGVATAAVAAFLLFRRQKSSRTVIARAAPHTGDSETRLPDEQQHDLQAAGLRNPGVYAESRKEWSFAEGQTVETPPSGPQNQTSWPAPNPGESYSASSSSETRNSVTEGFRKPAVGMDTSSLFSHMRAEFASVPTSEQERMKPENTGSGGNQEERFDIQGTPDISAVPRRERNEFSLLQHPSSISATDVMRWCMRAPVFILSDVVVPVAQVSSILWYDCKQWILETRTQKEKLYFIEEPRRTEDVFSSVKNDDGISWDWGGQDVELTKEEQQVKEFQENVHMVFGYAQRAFRGLFK